ncbi:MAG: hypothetical protein P4M11_15975 [Candidatus Pacebacteria bacterium]|nr:hypothetical protein [Candidatus Paceibacterota bacterium]
MLASQSTYEQKFAKAMKSGMHDKTVSRSVRTLQVMSVIVGIVLIVMSCTTSHLGKR